MIKLFDLLAHWGEHVYQANHQQVDTLVAFYGVPGDKNPEFKTDKN